MDSQCKQILDHLRVGLSITTYKAFELYGCTRLSARIKELRDRGHNIYKVMESANGKRYALYFMKRKAISRPG